MSIEGKYYAPFLALRKTLHWVKSSVTFMPLKVRQSSPQWKNESNHIASFHNICKDLHESTTASTPLFTISYLTFHFLLDFRKRTRFVRILILLNVAMTKWDVAEKSLLLHGKPVALSIWLPTGEVSGPSELLHGSRWAKERGQSAGSASQNCTVILMGWDHRRTSGLVPYLNSIPWFSMH